MPKWPAKEKWHDGVRMQFDFNDYILSVVKFTGSYGYKEDKWEVAFMHKEDQSFCHPPFKFMEEYKEMDLGIYGYLNDPEVDRIVDAFTKMDAGEWNEI
jgi:predicted N-formylglutamate amidohydrolase